MLICFFGAQNKCLIELDVLVLSSELPGDFFHEGLLAAVGVGIYRIYDKRLALILIFMMIADDAN